MPPIQAIGGLNLHGHGPQTGATLAMGQEDEQKECAL